MTPPPNLFIIADDHPLFRGALRHALAQLFPTCGIVEADSLTSLLCAVQANPDADLILLDLLMPGARGFSALVRIRAQYPNVPVAVISALEEPHIARRAFDFGASGFIPKSARVETIGAMLRRLLGGEVVFPADYREALSSPPSPEREAARRLSSLTPAQLRVLLMLADGYSNKSIAADLGISDATVKAHVTVILRKLQLERRTQAALLAQRLLHNDDGTIPDLEPGDEAGQPSEPTREDD